MDDPSPMMRFLAPALCAKASERTLQEETIILDRLCFHTAFYHIFDGKPKKTGIVDMASMLSTFRNTHRLAFSKLPFKLDIRQKWVPDPAQLAPATEAMTALGRACYSKRTCPFSKSGLKDADFILKVVESVAHVSNRISSMWSPDLKLTLPMALPAVYHRMLDASWDTNTERCKQMSTLILETSTLACYHLLYLELPKAKRQDPTNGTVRCLFWNAAFFYSQLHAMWDQQLDPMWLDDAIDKHVLATSDIRAELVDTTSKTMARIVAKDTALKKLDVQLRRTPASDPDARDVLENKRHELAELDATAFNFDHDIQSELESVLRIIDFLQMEGPYKPTRCIAPEPTATPAPRPPPHSSFIDAMMGDMGNLLGDDAAKKKKRKHRRRKGPNELMAALTLSEDEHITQEEPPEELDDEDIFREQEALVQVVPRSARIRNHPR